MHALLLAAHGQIPFGHGMHQGVQRGGLIAQLAHDAARNQPDGDGQQQGECAANEQGLDHALEEQGLHVIDIHPRAHHPAPGGVALDVGDFGHRLVVPRLGPEVFDKALPVFLHRIDKRDKQVLARGVGGAAQVLAVQLGADGVHQHVHLHVIHPEVLPLAIAQLADGLERPLFGHLLGQILAFGQIVVVRGNAGGNIDHAFEVV